MEKIDVFLTELSLFLNKSQIKTEAGDLEFYGQDWSKALTPRASAILFPLSTGQVSLILKSASLHGIKIIPSGGRTGLSGGAVATLGEVVVSLTLLNFIGPIHEGALTLKVGAGAITEAVHHYCRPHHLTWPVDFASKGSSTIGGNIATNAGGVRVIRYGNTRNWVLGLTVVVADGEVLHLNHELEKNNTGYDFRQLFIGSEGTLGIITEATLKLSQLPGSSLVFFFSLNTFEDLIQLFTFARKKFPNLSAFECVDQASMESVQAHFSLPAPVTSGGSVYALMELENTLFEVAETGLEEIFSLGLVRDGVMAQSPAEALNLWKYREGVAESILSGHEVHQQDVSVPVSKLQEFYAKIQTRYADAFPEFKVFFFGHIGDGNLHVFIQKPKHFSAERFAKETQASDLELFKVLAEYKGSISAEHGVGLLKKHALHFSRSASELEFMRLVKRAFDPQNTFNPGKVVDLNSTGN